MKIALIGSLCSFPLRLAALILLLVLLGFYVPAADYPPADHLGADLILQNGDRIWGIHYSIGTFQVPADATIHVLPHAPELLDSGFVEIHARNIVIVGTIDAAGVGYKGGDGGNGGQGGGHQCWWYPAETGDLGCPGSGPAKGERGQDGGYNVPGGNTDQTNDFGILIGSGAGGGDGGEGGEAQRNVWGAGGGGGGGGAGGCGGGCIRLLAINEVDITGVVNSSGATGENGSGGADGYEYFNPVCGKIAQGGYGGEGGTTTIFGQGFGGSGGRAWESAEDGSQGTSGGAGGGGGILIYCESANALGISGVLDARGGRNQVLNGGTVKIFYRGDVTTGTIYSPRPYCCNLDESPVATPTPTPTPRPIGPILVPQHYPTIQEALYAAKEGEEIIVAPGTYGENIHFFGKNVVLRSQDPTTATVIDGRNRGSVITFIGTELHTCVVSGFVITNGIAENGGGISGNGTHATIIDNTIVGNSTTGGNPDIIDSLGGGILNCQGLVRNNIIKNNSAELGGGLCDCHGDILNNVISQNLAEFSGGGLYNCDGLIQDNKIIDNEASLNSGSVTHGGGLTNCDGIIKNNVISGNSSYLGAAASDCQGKIRGNTMTGNRAHEGGAMFFCNGMIENNLILENAAFSCGGGLSCCYGTIQNNIISSNTATARIYSQGGALHSCHGVIQNNIMTGNSAYYGGALNWCSGIVRNNTFFENEGWISGGGLIDCAGTIANCIVWRNISPSGPQVKDCSASAYCCIQDWTGGGTGNISDDPQFVDPANGDFRLLVTSPCIDAGGTVTLAQDFEGDPRPWDGTSELRGDGSDFDIGADEYIGSVGFNFDVSAEGWTSGTAGVFAAPEWRREAGCVRLVSANNTNTFGFWQSPANAVPANERYLYRARFVVATDVTDQSRVPTIRLRVNAASFQQADVLTIDSVGDGGASPTPTGATYELYFVPPPNDYFCTIAFDLLNFDASDAPNAEIALESALVERVTLNTLGSPLQTWTYEFATGQETWASGDGQGVFSDPEFFWADGALQLRSTTNSNTFGYWRSAASDIVTSTTPLLYRGTFVVRTNVTSKNLVPQMRLRFNTVNLQASRVLGIDSTGDGACSPGMTNTTYDGLYFLPPENCVGEGLIVSFDMLNFSPDDAADGSLMLDRATIEAFPPPPAP